MSIRWGDQRSPCFHTVLCGTGWCWGRALWGCSKSTSQSFILFEVKYFFLQNYFIYQILHKICLGLKKKKSLWIHSNDTRSSQVASLPSLLSIWTIERVKSICPEVTAFWLWHSPTSPPQGIRVPTEKARGRRWRGGRGQEDKKMRKKARRKNMKREKANSSVVLPTFLGHVFLYLSSHSIVTKKILTP